MKYTKVNDPIDAIAEFSVNKLDLYTKKNEFEFIKIISIDDAFRYMHRLYIVKEGL